MRMNTRKNMTMHQQTIGRSSLKRTVLASLAAVALALPLMATASAPAPAVAAEALPSGTTARTAAGSCWEAKQNYPTSADGVYWLVTPALGAPQQFYCDMTTDGGGWVMIARGREGWKGQYNGLRTPAILRDTVDGPGAFLTAQLPGKTVDGLLNNGRVDALPDGVRLRRATTTDGSQRQEVRFAMPKRDRWVWTFRAEHPVGSYSFDGDAGSGGQTNNFGKDSALRRVDAAIPANQGYVSGFAFGSQVPGNTNASSYLWSKTDGLGGARPFTQMFLRPKLTIASLPFAQIPDTGAPAQTLRSLPESDAIRTTWGVAGLGNGVNGELNVEVSAFAQIGQRVYVGGNFKTVQRTATSTGVDQIAQPFLAAFDVNSGAFIPGFAPRLDNQVKALRALPDGRLAVGGQFANVNGESRRALVILDASTGATSNGWQVGVENRTSGGVPQVRGFSSGAGHLYVAGSFTHLVPPVGPTASAWNGARIALADGKPDTNWNPVFNGTSVGVDLSDDGTRVYFSGYFRNSNQVKTVSAAALQTTAGAAPVQPLWQPEFSKSGVDASGNVTGNVWQLGVAEGGGKVWLGGSEHSLFSYDRATFARTSGNITKNGGDFQTVESAGDIVFAGCHCGDFTYSNAFKWDGVGTGWTQADNINLFGAWDAQSGAYLQEFSPIMQARSGYGAWASFVDSTGTLWTGGDYKSSTRANEVNQWSGGFVRFAPRDSQSPSIPTQLTGTPLSQDSETLSWGASSDNKGSAQYEVIRDRQVIGTTASLQFEVPREATPVRYFVRAVDTAGNRSASTPVHVVAPPSASQLSLVDAGAAWKWRFDSGALPANWGSPSFDDSSWATGTAVLGFGSTGIATNIASGAPSPRPLSAQFRRTFSVSDARTVSNGEITVIADDGVVVSVNGIEVGRANLPAGQVSQNTYASAAPRSMTAGANRSVFAVPSSVLVDGQNVVSASVHMNYRSTPDASFDLRFTAERGQAPANPPPTAPTLSGSPTGAATASLTWPHDSASRIAEYRLTRDGTPIAAVAAPGATFEDAGLTPSTTYAYELIAVDDVGQRSQPSRVSVTTNAAPQDPTAQLIASGSEWNWRFSSAPLAADWYSSAFDDSSWSSGASTLGVNTPDARTDIALGAPSPRPLSAQFRSSFELSDSSFSTARITVIANDGVAVWVNGVEVGRANLPAGTLSQNSYATAAPRSSTAGANPVSFDVPPSVLVSGTNVVAATTHANYRATADLSFGLTMIGSR